MAVDVVIQDQVGPGSPFGAHVNITDGVTEARDSDGSFFTEKRLLQLLEQPVSSAVALLNRIEESVRAHIGAAIQFDDNHHARRKTEARMRSIAQATVNLLRHS
jgi:NADPH-dependent ferric siderophore reductase